MSPLDESSDIEGIRQDAALADINAPPVPEVVDGTVPGAMRFRRLGTNMSACVAPPDCALILLEKLLDLLPHFPQARIVYIHYFSQARVIPIHYFWGVERPSFLTKDFGKRGGIDRFSLFDLP